MLGPSPGKTAEGAATTLQLERELQDTSLNLGLLLFLALLVGAGIRGLRWGLELVPMADTRRDTVGRVLPVMSAVIWVAYLLFAARMLFKDAPGYIPFVVAALLGGVAIASWSAIRDALSGVFLKAGRVCKVGDNINVEGVRGRIAHMGLRVMTVETTEGDEAIIPYGQVSRSALLRTPVIDAGSLHVFRISAPHGMSTSEAKRQVRDAILRCHWSSSVREPQVVAGGDDTFEVTVFALDPDRAPDIESEVRRAVS